MPNGAQYQTVQTGYAGPWVDQVLQALGAPTTDSNRAALRAWAASEGTLHSNNPLAFSGAYPGATTCIAQCGSSSPIMAYSSPDQGATNTAAFILGNKSYASIVSAFRSDAGLQNIFSAINSSPWCAGCQSGSYPTALHVAAGGAFGGSSVAGGGGGQSGTPGPSGFDPNAAAFSLPILGTVLNAGQELKIKGWTLMIAGGAVAVVGLAVVLASLGIGTKAGKAVLGVTAVGKATKGLGGAASSAPDPPAASAPEPPAAADAFAAGREQGAQEGYAEGQYEQQTAADRARNRRAAADFRGRPRRQPQRERNLPPERTRAG